MKKTTLILVFLAIFALSANAKKARLYCQTTATSECASGFKFRVTANDSSTFDASYCLPSGQTCSVSNDNEVYLQACTKDYKNNPCSVGACYYTGLRNVCAKDFTTCTSTVDAYNFFCVNCNTIQNCAKCFVGYKNGAINTAEVCLGSTCATVTDSQVSVASCNANLDDFGASCSCCAKPTVNVSACVSNNAALSLTSVVNWIVSNSSSNSSSSNSTSSKFEPSHYLYTLAMLFIAFLVA